MNEQSEQQKERLLFVCTANMQRSPAAEQLFESIERYEARSAGTHPSAYTPLSQELVNWAGMIFVMEDEHRVFIEEHFDIGDTPIIDLNIPDRFASDDPALFALLSERISEHIPLN